MEKLVLTYFDSKYGESCNASFEAESLEIAQKEFDEAMTMRDPYGDMIFRGQKFDEYDSHFIIITLDDWFESRKMEK
jgi:hypothetical protein